MRNLLTDTDTPTSICSECGNISNRAGGEGTPDPGDFVLCIRCASLNIFDENLALRAPNDEEIFAAAADSEVQRVRKIIMDMNADFAGKA